MPSTTTPRREEHQRPGAEGRSHFVAPVLEPLAPSTTDPREAPAGTRWLHAYSSLASDRLESELIGKWLIYVSCNSVRYCWTRVREATEGDALGIAAKVSTDWGKAHDVVGMIAEGRPGWLDHVICVYTADWRDTGEVAHVGSRLAAVDAVRKQTLQYKPDAFTYHGTWSGRNPGDVAIYTMRPPFEVLSSNPTAIRALRDD